MAEYNGKQGHWVTTKEGRHLFIEDGENKAQAVRDEEARKLQEQAATPVAQEVKEETQPKKPAAKKNTTKKE